jgi:hypothetical protein
MCAKNKRGFGNKVTTLEDKLLKLDTPQKFCCFPSP